MTLVSPEEVLLRNTRKEVDTWAVVNAVVRLLAALNDECGTLRHQPTFRV
jgi:hypothetical protein